MIVINVIYDAGSSQLTVGLLDFNDLCIMMNTAIEFLG